MVILQKTKVNISISYLISVLEPSQVLLSYFCSVPCCVKVFSWEHVFSVSYRIQRAFIINFTVSIICDTNCDCLQTHLLLLFSAPRVKDIVACMPSGDNSNLDDLTDNDKYIPDGAPRLATEDTDTSDESSEEDEEYVRSSHCDTGSVDRRHWRKHLMDCCLPAFTDTSTQPTEVHSFLSYFRQFVTPSMMNSVVWETQPLQHSDHWKIPQCHRERA